MPEWGDKDHDWDAIYDCVEIIYEDVPEYVCQAKEKFGYLRFYVMGIDKNFESKYRAVYEKCVKKYPHMKKFILVDADYPEYLKGIVKEEDCDHPAWWKGVDKMRCGTCMMEREVC